MIEKNQFLAKYNITQEGYNATELDWNELMLIYNDYNTLKLELESTASYVFTTMMKTDGVHSIRYRIKDPEHVIEKIVRKKINDPTSSINLANYREKITDLIGIRILHLFKDDWKSINDYIIAKWRTKEKPVANYRDGDSKELIAFFKANKCRVHQHQYGYRSVHYIIITNASKQKYYVEIQVRTIFEEAWAEIDHTIRYPYDLKNQLYFQFLSILNRLVGSADEMGTYINILKTELSARELNYNNQLESQSRIIEELEKTIGKMKLEGAELESVKQQLKELKDQERKLTSSEFGSFVPSENFVTAASIYGFQQIPVITSALQNLQFATQSLLTTKNPIISATDLIGNVLLQRSRIADMPSQDLSGKFDTSQDNPVQLKLDPIISKVNIELKSSEFNDTALSGEDSSPVQSEQQVESGTSNTQKGKRTTRKGKTQN